VGGAPVPLVRSASILATGLAALVCVGCGASSHFKPTHTTSYSLPASVKSLKVKGEVGKVDVSARKGASKVGVVEKRTEKARPSHSVAGSTATLKYSCPGGFNKDTCRVDYDLTVPARAALDVDNSAGEITLNGALTDVAAKTDAGKIAASALGRGTVTASAKAGEVDLTFASAPRLVTTTTSAGSTTITVPGTASYRVKASTSVGDKNIKVPNDPSAQNRIEAKTDVGDVTIKKG
jgi:hypothetical protein